MDFNIFSVAPMMGWTTRHYRFFMRHITKKALLYTEMVTPSAILFGDRERFLAYHPTEKPLALQLGGRDKHSLLEASKIAIDYDFDEINLNIGCPSPRVQGGSFGACLMREPEVVVDILEHLFQHLSLDFPVSVKCRLGVDGQPYNETLPKFVELLAKTGLRKIIIHARPAWLKGLSPKENRTVPSLDYQIVFNIKKSFPYMKIILNGGLHTLEECKASICKGGVDGVMVGRSCYTNPYSFVNVDNIFFKINSEILSKISILESMMNYISEMNTRNNVPINSITRHMMGLMNGNRGAKRFRQILSGVNKYTNFNEFEKDIKEFIGI